MGPQSEVPGQSHYETRGQSCREDLLPALERSSQRNKGKSQDTDDGIPVQHDALKETEAGAGQRREEPEEKMSDVGAIGQDAIRFPLRVNYASGLT